MGGARRRSRAETRAELGRLTHDVRNALNGVAVNIEVARGRAARNFADPAAIAPFLEQAAAQLELVTTLHKEILALALQLAEPADAEDFSTKRSA